MSPSSSQNQRTARGIIVNRKMLEVKTLPAALGPLDEFEDLDEIASYQETYDQISFNGVGEGQVNVCGEGGDIQSGDLICTSNMVGKGMKQLDQDSFKPYTVAQSRETVTFSSPDEVKMIAVIYKCG